MADAEGTLAGFTADKAAVVGELTPLQEELDAAKAGAADLQAQADELDRQIEANGEAVAAALAGLTTLQQAAAQAGR